MYIYCSHYFLNLISFNRYSLSFLEKHLCLKLCLEHSVDSGCHCFVYFVLILDFAFSCRFCCVSFDLFCLTHSASPLVVVFFSSLHVLILWKLVYFSFFSVEVVCIFFCSYFLFCLPFIWSLTLSFYLQSNVVLVLYRRGFQTKSDWV